MVLVEGIIGEDGRMPPTRRMKWVAPGYYQTMGNPVVAGRDYREQGVRYQLEDPGST